MNLTPRETEVVKLIARGLSNRDIAERLDISRETVKVHVKQAAQKVRGKAEPRERLAVWFCLTYPEARDTI